VKKRVQDSIHRGRDVSIADADRTTTQPFDYGPLGDVPRFTGAHPKVMEQFISRLSWRDHLNLGRRKRGEPVLHKHQQLHCRLLSWVERNFTGRSEVVGWKNHRLLRLPSVKLGPRSRSTLSPP
jgi:hypothetical protein